MAEDLDKIFGIGGLRGPLPGIERKINEDFDRFLKGTYKVTDQSAMTSSDHDRIKSQTSRQITLSALSGLMLPRMVFPIRQQEPHQYEDGQNPQ